MEELDPLDLDTTAADAVGKKSADAEPAGERNWGLIIRLAVGVAIAVAFLLFVFQNADAVEINFLSWSFSMARSLVMVLSAVFGAVVWEFAGFISRRVRK